MLLSSTLLYASPPAWWNTRGVIDENAQEENYAVVNVGQAKWMATQAYAELSARLAPFGGVGFQLSDVIPDIPENPDALWYEQQKAVLNLGQLKAMALPFYDSLNQRLPGFLDYQAQINGIPWETGQTYPWNPDTPVEQNFGPVNIGQLKATFAFQFDADLDGNGVPDFSSFGVPTQPAGGGTGGGTAGGGTNGGTGNNNPGGGGNPTLRPDRDNDGVPDDEDGWALTSVLSPPRISAANYVVVEILNMEAEESLVNFEINNNLQAIVSTKRSEDSETVSDEGESFRKTIYKSMSYNEGALTTLPGFIDEEFEDLCYGEPNPLIRRAYKYTALNEKGHFLQEFNLNQHTVMRMPQENVGELSVANRIHESEHVGSRIAATIVDTDGDAYGYVLQSIGFTPDEDEDLVVVTDEDSACYDPSTLIRRLVSDVTWSSESGAYSDSFSDDDLVMITEDVDLDDVVYSEGEYTELYEANSQNILIGVNIPYNSGGRVREEFGFQVNGDFNSLVEVDRRTTGGPGFFGDGDIREEVHISNRNTIVLKQGRGSNATTTLWIDQNAGHRHDKEVNSSPNYQEIEWNPSWGAAPPVNLNANMQGFGRNGTANEGSVWMNGQWHNLIGEDLIDTTTYSNVQIHDINDNGTLAAVLEKPNGNKVAALLLPAKIIPDYNRDGVINGEDKDQVTKENPFRWWINDDNDLPSHERGSNDQDRPKQSPSNRDGSNMTVDGIRDLIDFFPVHLDIKDIVRMLPLSEYKYVLKNKDSALKFFEYPGCVIDGSNPGHFPNRHVKRVGVGRGLAAQKLKLASSVGAELSTSMLVQAREGRGVVVLEGVKKTSEPLVLEIIKKSDNQSIGEVSFPLSVTDVEDMYRHVNIRSETGGQGGHMTQVGEPSGYPDNYTNNKYVAFVHGFKTSGESSRGSHSNIFKRLHQLGSKARYIGVTWNGNPPSPRGDNPPDYHKAVENGLISAKILKDKLSFTEGSSLAVLAHSLGNVLVSHAIANHGLQVNQYYIINGAVPIEAYDSTQTSNSSNSNMSRNMTEDRWKPYYDHGEHRLFASNWHKLFKDDANDNRNQLTWKNIFKKDSLLRVSYNFYSPDDEIVENADSTEGIDDTDNLEDVISEGGRHAWVLQEIAKGARFNFLARRVFDNINGGWMFNYWPDADDDFLQGYVIRSGFFNSARMFTPSEASSQISDSQLRVKPFHSPLFYRGLYDVAEGSLVAGNPKNRYRLLATGIPASSYAVAANRLDIFGDVANFNMSTSLRSPGGFSSWPVHKNSKNPNDWMHGDFKEVSVQFVHPMYQKMIDLSNLDE